MTAQKKYQQTLQVVNALRISKKAELISNINRLKFPCYKVKPD